MTIAQLTEIVSLVDGKLIKERLKAEGYTDCGKRKVNKEINLAAQFLGTMTETGEYTVEQGAYNYKGVIYSNVQNHEGYQFIIIVISDSKNVYPMELSTWAKAL